MAQNNRSHATPALELVRELAAQGDRTFTAKQARKLAPKVGLSESYVRQALHHLVLSGWLVRLRQGLYALSSTTPGVSPVHEFEIAMALVSPAAISHWSAMHHHGLTEQAPRKTFVLTTTEASVPRTRGRSTGQDAQGYTTSDAVFQFVQVKPERFFGTEKVWVGEARVTFTDLERTLLDGLSRPQYCGDFAEVLHAFEAATGKLNIEKIIGYARRLDAATAKRLGWILEHQSIGSDRLASLLAIPIKGYRVLDPTGPRKGPCDHRWMIQENLPGKVDQ
jgi:predicted transcriptional regulator of viral defense system